MKMRSKALQKFNKIQLASKNAVKVGVGETPIEDWEKL